MKILLSLILFLAVMLSCNKIQDEGNETYLSGKGVFILNEGNFRWGNGSLSFYSYDSAKIYNDLFLNVNARPLGDVPNSMLIFGDLAYIIVNNSGKIEVVNKNTLKSESTITGLISPRNMAIAGSTKAYVTSMYSDSMAIINLLNNEVTGYINLRRTSESVIISGTKAFVSNWIGGNEIMVVNIINDKIMDSVKVGVEPESMVLDRDKMLWVLCNGGWSRTIPAELNVINTATNIIAKKIIFPDKLASPSCLSINGSGEILYFLEKGVRQMNIISATLPSVPLISESGRYFYKLGVDPSNNDIFVTDAVDYQKKGSVCYYKKDGTLVSTFSADIIPGLMCFKQ
jgi:DNA-binding beta-propeller fold protein YncE